MNATGTALIYATYLGGTAKSFGKPYGITFDANGDAYVTGITSVIDFPVTSGALQKTNKAANGGSNAFVTKLNSTGSALLYSTYLGGSYMDWAQGIAIDSKGNAYLAGYAGSTDFPVTSGAFQTVSQENQRYDAETAFIAKLNPPGSALVYSTYLGGSGGQVTCYQGGICYQGGEYAFDIALDQSDDAYVTAFFNATFLSNNGAEFSSSIGLDTSGNFYVAGGTALTNLPVTGKAFQTTNHVKDLYSYSQPFNAYVAKFAVVTGSEGTLKSITSTSNPSKLGNAITFTVDVTPAAGAGTPTGLVTLRDDGKRLIQVTLDGTGHAQLFHLLSSRRHRCNRSHLLRRFRP